jgi:exodeoxyribonuclease V alpha subunit
MSSEVGAVAGIPGWADDRDPFDATLAAGATGLLAVFNQAVVLAPADVHVARMLGRVALVEDEAVLLATALAVRAPRLGNVRVDLSSIADTATRDLDDGGDLSQMPWPEATEWVAGVARSRLAGVGGPLRLEGNSLYLDRYWCLEREVAEDLRARAGLEVPSVDRAALEAGLVALFPPEPPPGDTPDLPDAAGPSGSIDWQREAAAIAVLRRLSIIAGGPGTGKTTTIARLIDLLFQQSVAAGGPPPLIALAAPTGKAAARLAEAVHEEAGRIATDPATREFMQQLNGMTIHRLLRSLPHNKTRFWHNRSNRLIHDAVIIDETSMVPLSLMARLIEAVRPEARLVLAGDPEQLASVEAGAVLGDIVGPARSRAGDGRGVPGDDGGAPGGGSRVGQGSATMAESIVVLRRTRRFSGILAQLAGAIQRGDAQAALDLLRSGDPALKWIEVENPTAAAADAGLRSSAVSAGKAVVDAARAGDVSTALEKMGEFRILCGHRHGPAGALTWGDHVEGWLAAEIPGLLARGSWYPGRPLLVTANDYSLGLFNGDTGVVVAAGDGRLAAAFERSSGLEEVSLSRLGSVESAHAMTIHKSQGSQFRSVAVVLPAAESAILTRELLYTAVTRARNHVVLVGPQESVLRAIVRPITRASGLRELLWGT